MADLNCKACDDLRSEVPELIASGFSTSMCSSLKNDSGLKASSGHNDCTDLNDMNDCLIGNLETELEKYEVCDWKDFSKSLINNLWTTLKGMICAICGLWTNVHNLWTTIRSLCITKVGNKIRLTSNLGTHCEVTDSDTTYDLTISGHTVKLSGSDGSEDSVTVPDNDTKYGLSRSGHTVNLVEGGTNTSVTIPDDNTTYTLSRDGHTVTLNGSDGSTDSVTIPDNDHTRIGVTLVNVKMNNGLAKNTATGEKTITASTTRNSISGFEIWNENGGDILRPPSGIEEYKMFGLVGYSSDHWQIMSAGSFIEINNQTLTFQFVNMSAFNDVTDDVVIQFHIGWYRPDNND